MTKLWDTAKKTYEISDLYSKARISGEYRVVGELQEELDKIEISEVHWWTQLKENTGQAIRLPNPNEGETIAINKEFKIMVLYKREAGLSINSELGNPINTYKVL